MKIYVTGSSGLAGSNLCEALSAAGHEVVRSRSRDVDLLDFEAAREFIGRTVPDMVIHAAGKVGGIQANVEDPLGFFWENMQMGMNVVRAALAARVPRLLNLSSSCSYPCALERPLVEDDVFAGRLEPTNEGYAIAKAAITRMCEFASRRDQECRFKTIVPCNLYGRHDKFGEKNAHMIPAAIRKIHLAAESGRDEVEIWGDGQARREFLYAGDFAEMVAECAERFDELPQTMNLGLGRDYTVDEYYRVVADVVGWKGRFVHDLSRPAGMRRKLLDVTWQRRLGIAPRRTLAEGVRETYEWYLREGRDPR